MGTDVFFHIEENKHQSLVEFAVVFRDKSRNFHNSCRTRAVVIHSGRGPNGIIMCTDYNNMILTCMTFCAWPYCDYVVRFVSRTRLTLVLEMVKNEIGQ